jgi:hypothetical protein
MSSGTDCIHDSDDDERARVARAVARLSDPPQAPPVVEAATVVVGGAAAAVDFVVCWQGKRIAATMGADVVVNAGSDVHGAAYRGDLDVWKAWPCVVVGLGDVEDMP